MVKTDLNSYLDKFYYKISKINELLNGKSDIGHKHDERYYTETETDGIVNGLSNQINEKADKTTATTSANGLMSKEDKSKLDGIDSGANKTVVESSLSSTSTNPVQNKVINSALSGKANSSHSHSITDVTNLQSSLDSKAGTSIATTSADGLMSSSDKTKLDGIATGATKVTVDSSLSSSSTNPVQNKVVNSALNGKANSSHTHNISDVTGLSTSLDGKMNNDYSVSTIESNFFAHKIGNIVIVTWWNPPLPTAQNSWVDWKTLPYESCNTQHIWVDGSGMGREVRVRVPPNSNKLQVFISEGTGGIRAGMIVYPTK